MSNTWSNLLGQGFGGLIGRSKPPGQGSSLEVTEDAARHLKPEQFRDGYEPSTGDVFIAVMGVTGAGKSTFVSLCTEKQVKIGHDLVGCTQEVAVYQCKYRPGVNVYLIDTPGFDDTNRSDTEVLKEIAAWLTASYSRSIKLHGIIYLHRITDIRMQGSAKRNLFMFKKLCGADALKNVILATTMWEKVDEAEGIKREGELETTQEFWGLMKERGSRVVRHYNTRESAMNLIAALAMKEPEERVVLDIQSQMVDDGKKLDETHAGSALQGVLAAEHLKYQKQLAEIRADLEEAKASHDLESSEILLQHKQEMDETVKRLTMDQENLKISMERLHEERYAKLESALEDARSQSKQVAQQLEASQRQHEMQNQLVLQQKQFRKEADRKHKEDMDRLQGRLGELMKTPRIRSHPGRNRINEWTVSVSVYGPHYHYVAFLRDMHNSPPGVPADRLTRGNGNRYVKLGDQGSWYIHYHDSSHGCWTQLSGDFGRVYPTLERYITKHTQFGCPTSVALGEGGTYFMHTAWGAAHCLPPVVKEHLGDMSDIQRLWLGKDESYVGELKNGTLKYDLRGHYDGLGNILQEVKSKIKDMSLNLQDPGQWIVLWDTGKTSYRSGNVYQLDTFAYEEWCSQNFGTTWV